MSEQQRPQMSRGTAVAILAAVIVFVAMWVNHNNTVANSDDPFAKCTSMFGVVDKSCKAEVAGERLRGNANY